MTPRDTSLDADELVTEITRKQNEIATVPNKERVIELTSEIVTLVIELARHYNTVADDTKRDTVRKLVTQYGLDSDPPPQIMFAHVKYDNDGTPFFTDISQSEFQCNLYPKGEDGITHEVEVSVHPTQTRPTKTTGFTQEYWGWSRIGTGTFTMVYPSCPQFSMCFACGFEAEEDSFRGRAYRLRVRPIDPP